MPLTEQEIADIQAKSKAVEAENIALRASQQEAAFNAAKESAMAPLHKLVAEKRLEPGLRDKVVAAFDGQKLKFSAGSELAIPASMAIELSQSIKLDSAGANDGKTVEGSPDQIMVQEAYKIMATANIGYDQAVEIACQANPDLAKRWLGFTQEIHMKGVN